MLQPAVNAYPAGMEEGGKPLAWTVGGRVYLHHHPGGPYPVLKPGPGLELYVNGRRCTDPTPVRVTDNIEVRMLHEKIDGGWELQVKEGGLAAVLKLRPHTVIRWELADLPPIPVLQLAAKEIREYLPPASLEEILEAINRRGIVHGIDWEACQAAAKCAEEKEITIAYGTPPNPGEAGRVELLFSPKQRTRVTIDKESQVDFRERFQFTSVEAGTVLARKIPPTPGNNGLDVYGNLLLAPASKDVELVAGKGVTLSGDGMEAVAACSGRPVAQIRGQQVHLVMLEVLDIDKDVNLESGNITFQGDVRIAGSVTEGMKVKAGGYVHICGDVAKATVQAGGSVVVSRNVLSSLVVAGGTAAMAQEVVPLLHTLRERLKELLTSIEQVQQHPAFWQADLRRGLGPLLRLLLEGRFRDLPSHVRLLQEAIKTLPPEMQSENLTTLYQQLENTLVLAPLAVKDISAIELLAAATTDVTAEFAPPYTEAADLVLRYALNSTLTATGCVKVIGAGCYNTRILAGSEVLIAGSCRGGEVEAKGNVRIGELGSRSGVKTLVKVPARASVTIGQAWENTQVQVGNRTYHFERQERNIRLFLDKKGELRWTPSTRHELFWNE